MSRRRTAVLVVTLLMTVPLFGACSSGSSKPSTAVVDKRAARANHAAAVRYRRAVAKYRKQKARRTAKLLARPNASASTTPTTIETLASRSASGDLSEIRRTVDRLNAAFRASVRAGISNSEVANHWVGVGVYTGDQCAAFENARGQGVVAEELVLHSGSLVPTPGWVDPVIARVPQGRVYSVVVDEIQTLVPTGQRRAHTSTIHVIVQPDGNARLLLRCS